MTYPGKGVKNTQRRGHHDQHRKGYPRGISKAGYLLSLNQQLHYHNNGNGGEDGYCIAFNVLDA